MTHELTSILRQEIRNLRPGDRFPSQPDLARKFRISQGKVREALSALVHDGLLQQKRGSGTYVTAVGRRQIGIVIGLDISQPGTSPFWLQVTQKFRQHFEALGFVTRLYMGLATPSNYGVTPATGGEFWEDVRRHRLCGVVVVNCPEPCDWVEELAADGLPVRHMQRVIDEETFGSHGRMLAAGVRHLLLRGRRKIAVLDVGGANCLASPMYEHVRAALEAAGVIVPPEWQAFFPFPRAGLEGFWGIQRIWQAFPEKPDGILIGSDVLFPAAAAALQELRMPDDPLVVTHSLRGGVSLQFPVARLEVDPEEFAAHTAAHLLADMGEAPPPTPPEFLPFRLLTETGEVVRFPAQTSAAKALANATAIIN